LPISAAAYRVIEDIKNYNRIGGLKKEICRLATEIYAINEMSSPRNKAITALLELQALGITDDEIVAVYEFLNRARFEYAAVILNFGNVAHSCLQTALAQPRAMTCSDQPFGPSDDP
jgi:hypothetical protein